MDIRPIVTVPVEKLSRRENVVYYNPFVTVMQTKAISPKLINYYYGQEVAPDHGITTQTKNYVNLIAEQYPDLYFQVGGRNVVDIVKRVMQGQGLYTSPIGKLVGAGLAGTHEIFTLTPRTKYNPFAKSITVIHNDPALLAGTVGRYIHHMNQPLPKVYPFFNLLPPVRIYDQIKAKKYAQELLPEVVMDPLDVKIGEQIGMSGGLLSTIIGPLKYNNLSILSIIGSRILGGLMASKLKDLHNTELLKNEGKKNE